MATVSDQAQATNEKLDALSSQLSEITAWMKTMDASVADLTTTTSNLKLHAEDASARLGAMESRPPQQPPSSAVSAPAPLTGVAARRPDGHGYDNNPRGQVYEIPGSQRFPPANGTTIPPNSIPGHGEQEHFDRSANHSRYHSTPKMDFPKFDGTDPMIWKDNCEMFFEIYGISEMMKVKFAMLNFVGNAALWLKTVQSKQYISHWEDLYKAVETYWGKNKFNLFMRQILTIRQLQSVEVYTEKFNNLKHQILLHAPTTSEVFFVERFIAGLSDELRSSVLLHLPEDVDTASLLAQLQETEQENMHQQHSSRSAYRAYTSPDKTKPAARADDTKKVDTPRWDDKLEALRSFRKSKGLCFTCGDKWSRTHKCPAQVPLHVLEELLDVLPMAADSSGDTSSDDELMCVDLAAAPATTPARRRTIRLHGRVGPHEVLILVDSGSGASFLDASLVDKLQAPTQPCEPSRFVVANGEIMTSDRQVLQLPWSMQDHEFVQDMKMLPLTCYDIILGCDWLEEHSPMWVHWRQRRMCFTHAGRRITLQGIQDDASAGRPTSPKQLQGLLRRGAVAQCVQVLPVHQRDSLHIIQHKAFAKLMGIHYTIQYKKGITNAAADALSRQVPDSDLMAISSAVPSWLDKLVSGYMDDAITKQLWIELSDSGSNKEGFSLAKYGHFIPLKHPYTALQVARSFTNNIHQLHGLPQCIISDRDKIFTSNLWQELFRLTDAQLLTSSAYHPQRGGQTERLNQCLEAFQRCTVHACPAKWFQWLPLAEFWYNTYFHSAIGRAPFEALYGHPPRHFGISATAACAVPDLDFWLQERELMTTLLRQHLIRAQHRMKKQVVKHRTERFFTVGDQVLLKLQLYGQTSLAPRSSQKLAFKFFGPYKILACVGVVAYKLDLPPISKIHNVVHVPQLKRRHLPATQLVSDDISLLGLDDFAVLQPAEVLARRRIQRGGASIDRVLVRWHELPAASIPWEDTSAMQHHFPSSLAWGQASSQGGTDVTTLPGNTGRKPTK